MTRFFNISRSTLLWLPGVTLLFLSACATTIPTENAIKERAMARWDALLSDDYAAAYEYLSPAYRSSVSLKQYQRFLLLMKVKWDKARYIESDCTETICKVTISLDYTAFGAVPGVSSFNATQKIEENWLRSGGHWYVVPEK